MRGVVVEDVDFDAQIAELEAYSPDFTDEDISLPEGTYLEEGELVVTDGAPEVVQDVLLESGFAEGEMSRADDDDDDDDDPNVPEAWMIEEQKRQNEEKKGGDTPEAPAANNGNAGGGDKPEAPAGDSAAVQYMQQYNATQKAYQNYDALASYAPEVLGYIHPTAGKVGEMGANAYRIFKGFYTNNWGSAIQGTMGVLKMFGLFKGGSTGVSNAQLLSEIQKVGLEVCEMHELTKAMNATLNETLKQAYRNNLQTFDNAVVSLHSNAEVVQSMLVEGAIRAAEDGIEPPAEDCDAEDEFEYNYELIEYIEGLEKKGGRKNTAFKGFSGLVDNLRSDFVLVSGEVAKPGDSNPVKAYDKYWDLHFNFDTQGYYLRQSYRSNIEYELKRAFGLLDIYYNIFDPYDKGAHSEYNTELFAALDRLEELNAGTSPEDVLKGFKREWVTSVFTKDVHCNTLNKDIYFMSHGIRVCGNNVSKDLINEYVGRLHGRTVVNDLKLAGMWYNRDAYGHEMQYTAGGDYHGSCHGIGFNLKENKSVWTGDVIRFDNGRVLKDHKLYDNYKDIDCWDDSAKHKYIPVLYFQFR